MDSYQTSCRYRYNKFALEAVGLSPLSDLNVGKIELGMGSLEFGKGL